MIIQSKFHDYYDKFAKGDARDPKIVYARQTETKDGKSFPAHNLNRFTRPGSILFGIGETHHVCLLLICGRIYPMRVDHNTVKKGWTTEKITHISYTDVYHHFQESKKKPKYGFLTQSKEEAVWGQEDPEALELNNTQAPVILIGDQINPLPEFDVNKGYVLNPNLGILKFPMHGGELLQLIMGFLGAKEPKTVATEDSYRALAHGMDKSSFRREKGGPTRKRKNAKANTLR